MEQKKYNDLQVNTARELENMRMMKNQLSPDQGDHHRGHREGQVGQGQGGEEVTPGLPTNDDSPPSASEGRWGLVRAGGSDLGVLGVLVLERLLLGLPRRRRPGR